MKILSLLLLLALGLGAAWWTQANPGGTLDDARGDADVLAARAGVLVERARAGAVDALGLTIGREDAGSAAGTDEPVVADEPAATEALPSGGEGGASDDTGDPEPTSLASVPDEPSGTDGVDGAAPDVLARLDAIEAALAAPSGDGTPLAARLADIEDRLAMLDERMLTLADRLDTIGTARLARALPIGGNAGAAPSGDAAAGGDADAARSAEDEGTDVVDADEGADTFAEDVPDDPLASRIDSLAAGLDRRLARLEEQTASAGTGRAGAGSARLDALSARIDALATDDTSVDDAQAELLTELAVLDGQVGDDVTRADAPMLGEALDSTRDRLETLEARVQAMPETSAAADAAKTTQDALERQVRALEERLEALSGVDPAITSSIDEVRDQVDALESRGFVTQDELREQTEGRNVEYKIYFDAGSTEVSEAAARVLDSFIVQEQNRTTGVSIFGFTDRRGSASFNQRLALERATNVRSYLIRNGLPYTKIRTLSGLGEDAAAAVLPDDADDAQQRVVVLYAAQP